MVPNSGDADHHVAREYERVQDEQEEEALVLQADAVVGEEAVVAHLEDASVAHAAVVGAGRLQLITYVALAVPEALQVAHRLGAVLHQALDIFLKAFKPVIFRILVIKADFSFFPAFALFVFESQLLYLHQVSRTTRFDNHG